MNGYSPSSCLAERAPRPPIGYADPLKMQIYFCANPKDENDYRLHIEYIHYNPAKHGLVAAPKDWPHSSFHRFVAKNIYPESWGGPVTEFPEKIGGE